MPDGDYIPSNYTYTVDQLNGTYPIPGATWNTDVLTQKPTVMTGTVNVVGNHSFIPYNNTYNADIGIGANNYIGNNYTYTGGFVATEAFDKHSAEILAIKKFLGLDKEEPPKEKPSKKPSKRVHYDYPGDGSRWGDL